MDTIEVPSSFTYNLVLEDIHCKNLIVGHRRGDLIFRNITANSFKLNHVMQLRKAIFENCNFDECDFTNSFSNCYGKVIFKNCNFGKANFSRSFSDYTYQIDGGGVFYENVFDCQEIDQYWISIRTINCTFNEVINDEMFIRNDRFDICDSSTMNTFHIFDRNDLSRVMGLEIE